MKRLSLKIGRLLIHLVLDNECTYITDGSKSTNYCWLFIGPSVSHAGIRIFSVICWRFSVMFGWIRKV